MIYDIDENVSNSSVRSFADDTRVTKGITNVHTATQLQIDLDSIYEWAEKNHMCFNGDKFELLRFRVPNSDIQDCTSYLANDGTVIKESHCVKDLGVWQSDDCSFDKHINTTIEKMKNMCSWILRTFETRDSVIDCLIAVTTVLTN